jgi:hypothetical protein
MRHLWLEPITREDEQGSASTGDPLAPFDWDALLACTPPSSSRGSSMGACLGEMRELEMLSAEQRREREQSARRAAEVMRAALTQELDDGHGVSWRRRLEHEGME